MKCTPVLLTLFILLFGSLNCIAQTKFYTGSIEQMYADSKANNKSTILEFVTPWCQACKRMDKEVFVEEKTAKYLNDNFYVLKVNAESPEFAALAKDYMVSAYPTFIVSNAKRMEQGRIIGYYSQHSFLDKLKNFRHKVPNNQYTEFR